MNPSSSTINFSPATTQDAAAVGAALSSDARPVISVVIPVYRAQRALTTLHERLTATLSALAPTYEIIFVEDCSPDNSWGILEELARQDAQHCRALKLSRNYGQQAAITAGLAASRGQWCVVMDCDLEDPPEFIQQLFAKAQTGYDIVWAKRATGTHTPARTLFSRLYFGLLSALTRAQVDDSTGSFTLISRPVVDSFQRFSDYNRHYKLILLWLGFSHGYVEYNRSARQAEGKSSYSIKSLVTVAMHGIFFQSTLLLEWIVGVGFLTSFVGMLAAVFAVVEYCLCPTILPGWTSIVVLLLLLGGFNLIAIGVVGLYVGQIFEQVKARPLYIVQKRLNEPA